MRNVFSLLLITLWSSGCQSTWNRHSPIKTEQVVTIVWTPTPSNTTPQQPNESKTEEVKETGIPESFKHIDFNNFSYGRYRFPSSARSMNLRLAAGEREYEQAYARGLFSLHNIYYADVTHDQKPEAIVLIWHLSCGVSCDGGSGIIYIYEANRNKLRRIWQYETGSFAYGCGLKSLTIRKGNVAMELFGRCKNPPRENPGSGKFIIPDTTQLNFRFNGRRLVRTSTKILSVSERNVMNYETKIRIN